MVIVCKWCVVMKVVIVIDDGDNDVCGGDGDGDGGGDGDGDGGAYYGIEIMDIFSYFFIIVLFLI